MDMNDIRNEKHDLEYEITEKINAFSQKYGCEVDLKFDRFSITRIGDKKYGVYRAEIDITI